MRPVNTDGCWYLSGHAWLCSPSAKRELLAFDARRRNNNHLSRRRCSRASPEPDSVSRAESTEASLLEDSLAFLRSVPDSDLTKELKIEFVASRASTPEGSRRVLPAVGAPSYSIRVVGRLVQDGARRSVLQAACDWYLDEYELAGLLVGLAVYNSVVLEVRCLCGLQRCLHTVTPSSLVYRTWRSSTATSRRACAALAFDGDVENIFVGLRDDDPAGLPAVDK